MVTPLGHLNLHETSFPRGRRQRDEAEGSECESALYLAPLLEYVDVLKSAVLTYRLTLSHERARQGRSRVRPPFYNERKSRRVRSMQLLGVQARWDLGVSH